MIDFRRVLALEPAEQARVRTWGYGTLAAALALVLVSGAWDAHRRNAVLLKDLQEADAEVERVQADSRRLRAELKALNEDPVYVEGVLRWMQAASAPPPAR